MKKEQPQIKFEPSNFEPKWQKYWEEYKTYSPDMDEATKPFYNLMMFPYPSAEGMHVGNMYAQTGSDIYGRFMRMKGFDVFEPIGLDGFGIHSENFALKIRKHPMDQADTSEANFYRQMRSTGSAFDWERTVETYKPEYYHWTQWLFIQMFKNGLAYRQKARVNWCPSCKTVLSDEQVITGECERCGTVVEHRDLEQWFFRITHYAEKLLKNLETLDWTERVKIAQKNWIGQSKGAKIVFKLLDGKSSIEVFTTRPDTLYGATFMVISPEHPIVNKILDLEYSLDNKQIQSMRKYIEEAAKSTDIERSNEDRVKTGIFSGLYATNPASNEKIPVWIADYVLMGYGTGAIMAVPAHDARDFEFAKIYDLPIRQVVQNPIQKVSDQGLTESYSGFGVLINSEDWNGLKVPEEMSTVLASIEERNIGTSETNYHLRDWLISRQRYWGPPIPMIYCENCAKVGKSWFTTEEGQQYEARNPKHEIRNKNENQKKENSFEIRNSNLEFPAQWAGGWYPVSESDLPVTLPLIEDFKPLGTGKSPLANHPEFYGVKCPECGSDATRETDVSDTFLDSAWYFLRYTSTDIEKAAYDAVRVKKWLPVNIYIGGAEHSVLHLLYARFVTMALHDMKLLDFEEPFTRFYAHGLIIKEGAKMSKSKGNVVVPDEYISKYGADTLRMYLMFLGPFNQGGDFYDTGIEGMNRFVKRVWTMLQSSGFGSQLSNEGQSVGQSTGQQKTGILETENGKQITDDRMRFMHKTIKVVTEDLQNLSYNTAIARLMEWYNFLTDELRTKNSELTTEEVEVFLKLMAPFAPYMTEELWERFSVLGSQLSDDSQSVSQSVGQLTDQLKTDKQVAENRIQKTDYRSIHLSGWPEFDEKYLVQDIHTVVIQINGKRRAEIQVSHDKLDDKELVEKQAQGAVSNHLEGKQILKVIHIPGKIINFVVN